MYIFKNPLLSAGFEPANLGSNGKYDNHYTTEKKSKAVPLHAMKALGGRGGIAPTHSRPRHNMGVSGQRHAPAALYPRGKDPR
jgi:hypothetical protein